MLMIERILGYNNRRMWQHCELLQSIVEQKVMTKVGRGKNAVNVEVYKYKNNDDVIKNISESIDYYRIETMKELERDKKLTFRDYQKEIILNGTEMLLQNKFLYLAMEVRTGKTLTSLAIAEKVNANNVLFVTKKKAISSIESDYALFGPNYNICIINYESLHLVKDDQQWDLIVLDEAHSMGAFPKPSQRALIDK
jgi:superfamily II DNA or RNA helicase